MGDNLVSLGIALVAAIPPTLMAWKALSTSRRNAIKADTLIVKAEQIHLLTNSAMTHVKAELAHANEKIEALEKLVVSLAEKRKSR